MMKKIDQENSSKETPLLSQNISIIEVGSYAQVFEKFIDFIGVKSLIITDIDSAKKDLKKCNVADEDAQITTNASLKFFYKNKVNLACFIALELADKKLQKNNTSQDWVQNSNGHLVCIFQLNEKNSNGIEHHARSFEDAFFHINKQFFYDNLQEFPVGIKNLRYMSKEHNDYTDNVSEWAEKCVNKKPALAMEILLNSKTDESNKQFSNWNIPLYIKEGLIWLKQN